MHTAVVFTLYAAHTHAHTVAARVHESEIIMENCKLSSAINMLSDDLPTGIQNVHKMDAFLA